MIRFLFFLSALCLIACAPTQGVGYPNYPAYQPAPGQGQYIRPEYLNPAPTPMINPIDDCQSYLFRGLIGRHEGAIYIAGLPGTKRILKPAFVEGPDVPRIDGIDLEPPLLEVRDYLPGQILYAPSIRTVSDRIQLGPANLSRLTIELDREGYVQEVVCR